MSSFEHESPPSALSDSPTPLRRSRLAVASVVLGVLSVFVWLLASVPGIACGIMALSRIRLSKEGGSDPRLSGRGLAITGIAMSSMTTLSVPVMIALLIPAVKAARNAALATNVSQLSLAMIMAENRMNGLPAAIIDSEGKQLLSWRVAILPYLGDEAATLFKEFHLNEPWDSDHNKLLIGRMPAVYAAVDADASAGLTGTVVPTGPGTAMSDPEPIATSDEGGTSRIAGVRLDAFTQGDGASVTVVMVAAPNLRIPWTQPADLVDDPADAFATLHEAGIARVVVALADGSVRRLRTDLEPEQVRALFSRNGGDFVTDSSLNE